MCAIVSLGVDRKENHISAKCFAQAYFTSHTRMSTLNVIQYDTAAKSVDSQWVSILEHSVILRNYVQ